MKRYELTPGGARTGELAVVSDRVPDADGLIVMPASEFDAALVGGYRHVRDGGTVLGYDAVNNGSRGTVVLFPAHMGFDCKAVQRALRALRAEA